MFETGNPIRYYLPLADVRSELLTKSEYVSPCPYKGDGQHWHLSAGGDTIEKGAARVKGVVDLGSLWSGCCGRVLSPNVSVKRKEASDGVAGR